MKARLLALAVALMIGFGAGYYFAQSQFPKNYIIKPGPAMTEQQLRAVEPWRN